MYLNGNKALLANPHQDLPHIYNREGNAKALCERRIGLGRSGECLDISGNFARTNNIITFKLFQVVETVFNYSFNRLHEQNWIRPNRKLRCQHYSQSLS